MRDAFRFPWSLQCVAFDDINPQASVHFLVIPRKEIAQLSNATEDDKEVGTGLGLNMGMRVCTCIAPGHGLSSIQATATGFLLHE